jgi:hypothetical protein
MPHNEIPKMFGTVRCLHTFSPGGVLRKERQVKRKEERTVVRKEERTVVRKVERSK